MTTKKDAVIYAQPTNITVTGNYIHALQEVAVLCRQGYMPSPDMPMTVFQANGTVSILMVIGTPDQIFVDRAAVLAQEAAERVYADFRKEVAEEATRQIAANAEAEKAAKLVLLRAEQAAQLAALEASFKQ